MISCEIAGLYIFKAITAFTKHSSKFELNMPVIKIKIKLRI